MNTAVELMDTCMSQIKELRSEEAFVTMENTAKEMATLFMGHESFRLRIELPDASSPTNLPDFRNLSSFSLTICLEVPQSKLNYAVIPGDVFV
ncbi:hypothetical protein SKAU_G00309740 [Synaphobranchus kaupii]|uniref:Uncharacterized protein n=1 Tax=Synaphobranchus kaupii TaxID=118154 RepID=A0A9Q1IL88_SYNKA|nr:hypothetical protein SKAU_G00309740 [Synaphobranchus kaupii]